MEFGEYVGVSAIVVAIFLATAVYVWQSSRSDARIEKLDSKIEQQVGRLDSKIEQQVGRLDSRIEQQMESLHAEIKEQGKRVSESELEQARLNGVNSVLVGQSHTHEMGG